MQHAQIGATALDACTAADLERLSLALTRWAGSARLALPKGLGPWTPSGSPDQECEATRGPLVAGLCYLWDELGGGPAASAVLPGHGEVLNPKLHRLDSLVVSCEPAVDRHLREIAEYLERDPEAPFAAAVATCAALADDAVHGGLVSLRVTARVRDEDGRIREARASSPPIPAPAALDRFSPDGGAAVGGAQGLVGELCRRARCALDRAFGRAALSGTTVTTRLTFGVRLDAAGAARRIARFVLNELCCPITGVVEDRVVTVLPVWLDSEVRVALMGQDFRPVITEEMIVELHRQRGDWDPRLESLRWGTLREKLFAAIAAVNWPAMVPGRVSPTLFVRMLDELAARAGPEVLDWWRAASAPDNPHVGRLGTLLWCIACRAGTGRLEYLLSCVRHQSERVQRGVIDGERAQDVDDAVGRHPALAWIRHELSVQDLAIAAELYDEIGRFDATRSRRKVHDTTGAERFASGLTELIVRKVVHDAIGRAVERVAGWLNRAFATVERNRSGRGVAVGSGDLEGSATDALAASWEERVTAQGAVFFEEVFALVDDLTIEAREIEESRTAAKGELWEAVVDAVIAGWDDKERSDPALKVAFDVVRGTYELQSLAPVIADELALPRPPGKDPAGRARELLRRPVLVNGKGVAPPFVALLCRRYVLPELVAITRLVSGQTDRREYVGGSPSVLLAFETHRGPEVWPSEPPLHREWALFDDWPRCPGAPFELEKFLRARGWCPGRRHSFEKVWEIVQGRSLVELDLHELSVLAHRLGLPTKC